MASRGQENAILKGEDATGGGENMRIEGQPKIDFVLLPDDDPRAIQASGLYPPISIPGIPDHPRNMFFSVDGIVADLIPGLAYLREMTPLPSPLYFEYEDNWSENGHEEDTGDQTKTVTPTSTKTAYTFHDCKVCGKPFQYKSKLERHVVKHSAVKPFVCQTCGNRFSYKGNLKSHENKFHKNKQDKKKCSGPSAEDVQEMQC